MQTIGTRRDKNPLKTCALSPQGRFQPPGLANLSAKLVSRSGNGVSEKEIQHHHMYKVSMKNAVRKTAAETKGALLAGDGPRRLRNERKRGNPRRLPCRDSCTSGGDPGKAASRPLTPASQPPWVVCGSARHTAGRTERGATGVSGPRTHFLHVTAGLQT